MGTILKGASLVEFEPASVEVADLRIDGQRIVARAPSLVPGPGDDLVLLHGKVVMPGLVSGHHHLYATLARGMPGRDGPAAKLQALEDALDLDAVQAAATAGGLEALLAGTTTVFDRHASPKAVEGSLTRVARGLNEVGLRGVLGWEVSDRKGPAVREEALAETVAFHHRAQGRFRAMVGACASHFLSHEGMAALRQAVEAAGDRLHLTLAEDPGEQRLCFERFGEVPLARWMGHGLLGPKTMVAHAVHLSWPELAQVLGTGAWLVHSPAANMQGQVGYAPAGKFGARATLGTAGQGGDVLAQAQLAHLRACDAGQPIDALRYLANGHRIASEAFGERLGPLRENALADLVVLDYRASTPLSAQNLPVHLLQGFGGRVESVMVDGVWRLWGRRPLSVNPELALEHAREAAGAAWAKVEERYSNTPAAP